MQAATSPATALDHLVVMADSLAQGVAWCEATLGVTPAPGGQHPLFGTHNRLLAIGTPRYPGAYLELIAIDPGAAGADEARRTRWFDMDDAALRERVRRHGPQLIHWVARVPDVAQSCAALARLGIDRGEILQASRLTATVTSVPTRVDGTSERTITLQYNVPSMLGMIGINSIPVTYTRPVFIA